MPEEWKCEDCGRVFDEPLYIEERHGLPGPYKEVFAYCPWCRSSWIDPWTGDEEETE